MGAAAADWRNAASYERLLPGDRRCFAWEWLRRTPAYAAAWARSGSPAPFGLLRLEDPAADTFTARPIWSAALDSAVLRADILPGAGATNLSLPELTPLVTALPDADGTVHLLLSDGLRSIRCDLQAASTLAGPLVVVWRIAGVRRIGPQLTALSQLAALSSRGGFTPSLHPPQRRAARWIAMLRVHDALNAGATTREIVAAFFKVPTSGPRWRVTAAPWRLRVQRLAQGGRKFLKLGAAEWLDWPSQL